MSRDIGALALVGYVLLVGYVVLAVALLGKVLVMNQRLRAGEPNVATPPLDNRPYCIAYLNGGKGLAVLAALSSMWVAGTILTQGRGQVLAHGQLAEDTSELDQAIHVAASAPIRWNHMDTDPNVLRSLDQIRRNLEVDGLRVSAEQRRQYNRVVLWLVPVGLLGLAPSAALSTHHLTLAGGIAERRVALLVVLVSFAAAFIQRMGAQENTCHGAAEVMRLRAQHPELAPQMRPNWAVYGPACVALAVGLFGTKALWASEPGFTEELGALTVNCIPSGIGED